MAPTVDQFTKAIELQYEKTHDLYEGYIVIDRESRILRWSQDVSRFFKTSQTEMMAEDAEGNQVRTLGMFLPKRVPEELHKKWVKEEYTRLDEAISSGETYHRRSMSIGGKPRTIEGFDKDHSEIHFSIELCPLDMRHIPKEGHYLVGFITTNEDLAAKGAQIATAETVEVVKNLKNPVLRKADEGFTFTFNIVGRIYRGFHNNTFQYLEPAQRQIWSSLLTGATCVLILLAALGGWTAYELVKNRKPPTLQPIEIPLGPAPSR